MKAKDEEFEADNKNASFMELIKLNNGELEKFFLYYQSAIMEIETKLNIMRNEFMIKKDRNPISTIQSRMKKPGSIVDKLKRQGLPITLEAMEENLNDIAGIRVICSFLDDVYMMSDALISQDDVKLIRVKDYIKKPKPNGYRSLHLIIEIPIFLTSTKKNVRVEVQFRTIAMDSWASLEHQLKYKKEFVSSGEIEDDLKECSALCAEVDDRMNSMRRNILDNNE